METNKRQSAPREALRFAVSGGACFLIEFAALSLLKKTGMPTLAANAIAFLISVALNYLLCVKWVFPQASDGGAAARAGFLITSLIGLALNEAFMFALIKLLGDEAELATVASFTFRMYHLNKLICALLVMIWNYFTKKSILTGAWTHRLSEKLEKRRNNR